MAVTRGRTTSTPYNPLDVVLCMALALKFHGTADAIRQTARGLRERAPYEHRPKLKQLATAENDGQVLAAAWHMVDRSVETFGGAESKYPAPRCHMKPMVVQRHLWVCRHCKHTKERML